MKKKYIWLLIFLYILFIFSNSLQVGSTSSSISGGFTTTLLSLLKYIGIQIEYATLHHFIRKTAHFIEYAVLGILVFIAINIEPLLQNQTLNFILFWILPASLDETIQVFVPDRNGCITDVLLDMSGFLTGSLLIYLIHMLVKKHSLHREHVSD
jgi:VanZ family protein